MLFMSFDANFAIAYQTTKKNHMFFEAKTFRIIRQELSGYARSEAPATNHGVRAWLRG